MREVIQTRGSTVETVHPFSWRVVRGADVVAGGGDDRITTWRSASKPLQLACSLELLGDPEASEDELAVGAASHSAEPIHVAIVESLLARFGLSATDLRCGAHPPIHVPSAEAILRAGGRFTDLHNNCSGKHTFMVAAARHRGWDLDYRPAEHPLQRHISARVSEWTGCAHDLAVDGCGVPTFCLPTSAIARGWARIAAAMAAGEGAEASVARLGRIGRAMSRRPDLTSGTGRFDQAVVRAATEPMAVKIGAQGVFCVALPDRGLGVAIKVHSGSSEALAGVIGPVLATAAPGAWHEPEGWSHRDVTNVVGRVVGRWDVR